MTVNESPAPPQEGADSPAAQARKLRAAGAQADRKAAGGNALQGMNACQPDECSWIEIELIGRDGKGVKDQRYLIKGPDGRTFTGKTDARGKARVDGVAQGTCTVRFIDLDQETWQAL